MILTYAENMIKQYVSLPSMPLGRDSRCPLCFLQHTGYSVDKLLDLGRFSTHMNTRSHTSQAWIITHTSTCTHPVYSTGLHGTNETWKLAAHIIAACYLRKPGGFYSVSTFIQTGKLSTFWKHILFKATARGVVEPLLKTISMSEMFSEFHQW